MSHNNTYETHADSLREQPLVGRLIILHTDCYRHAAIDLAQRTVRAKITRLHLRNSAAAGEFTIRHRHVAGFGICKHFQLARQIRMDALPKDEGKTSEIYS